MSVVYLANLIAVGLFGMILSVLFCDISWTPQKRRLLAVAVVAILLFQGIVYMRSDVAAVHYFYPLITHLPLAIALCILSKRYFWSFTAVLTAYLFCEIRRWIALLFVAVCGGGEVMQNTIELIVTVPLLILLIWYVAPSVRLFSRRSVSAQWQFGLIPALYYGFDYVTRVYSDLLTEGSEAALEFMPFVCSVAYMVFVLFISRQEQEKGRLEQMQNSLNLQIAGAAREIDSLRKTQENTRLYRHDMRHHMQYLSACIENGRYEQAQSYIGDICSEIEADKVTIFCENDAANLIFSAFAGRAKKQDISMEVWAALPQNLSVSENDLCVLLSNALENALNACKKQKEKGLPGSIAVTAYEKGGKLLLQIVNSCGDDVTFVEGLPVAKTPGHGIGVRSICAIVERYGGIYSFLLKDRQFILRASL